MKTRPLYDAFWVTTILATTLVCGIASAAGPYPQPAPCHTPLLPATAVSDTANPEGSPRGYDVLSYDLTLDIDPVARQLAGHVDVGLQTTRTDMNRIVLDLVQNMVCEGVSGSTGDLAFRHSGDSLTIYLPRALVAAVPETMTISYHGRPLPHGVFAAGFMWRTRDNGTPDDPTDDIPIIATVVEPWSAHSWWPCHDVPGDKALVSLNVTVPDDLQVIANGTLLGSVATTTGKLTYQWREAYPIATYLVSVAITDYESWDETCYPTSGQPVELEFHAFAEDLPLAKFDLAPTCSMLEMMTDIAGPYPFTGEKYAQAEIKWIGAMEHQTATSISQIFLTGDRANENIVIHELSHQWFGDSLTPSTWPDIWLNEGFARYCEALWVQRNYGPEAYRGFMHDIGINRHPDLFAGEGILTDPDPILPNILIYNKGAWVLHMLRMLIGDDDFFSFLHTYANEPELIFGSTDTATMIAAAELAAGRSLTSFFAPLLQTDAVPQIQVETHPDPALITLTQLQSPLFELPITVRIYSPTGTRDEIITLTAPTQTFSMSESGQVDSLVVDPEGMTLMRTKPAPERQLVITGPRPNPATAAGAAFKLYIKNSSQVIVSIYDTRGMLVEEENIGLLEATGSADAADAVPHLFQWPQPGAAAPASGVYWLRFATGSAQATRKLTLIH